MAEKPVARLRKGGAAMTYINPRYWPIDSESYKFLDEDLIGIGVSKSTVYKAICTPLNSTVVAIKVIDLGKPKPDFETTTCTLIDHPNLLRPHRLFTVENSLWVVMPFISGGSLQSIVASSYPHGLPEPCIAAVLKQILIALSYLHNQGHLHRGIKAANILIDSITGSVKLADFGISATLRSRSYSTTSAIMSGTHPYWIAPEVIYGFSYEIWSFGITALELAHGRSPLSPLSSAKSLEITDSFKDMVGLCLNRDLKERPSVGRLLEHPFFQNCKGPDFLVENMLLQGVPALEQRSKGNNRLMRKIGDDDNEYDSSSTSGEIVEHRMTSGWNFNSEGFCLDPIFPDEDEDEDEDDVYDDGAAAITSLELIKSMEFMKKMMDGQKKKAREITESLKGGNMEEPELVQNVQEMQKEMEKYQMSEWFELNERQRAEEVESARKEELLQKKLEVESQAMKWLELQAELGMDRLNLSKKK